MLRDEDFPPLDLSRNDLSGPLSPDAYAATGGGKMRRYEWLARTIFPGRDGDATLTAHLNDLDDEGWEIVQVVARSPSGDGICVVARRLRPEATEEKLL